MVVFEFLRMAARWLSMENESRPRDARSRCVGACPAKNLSRLIQPAIRLQAPRVIRQRLNRGVAHGRTLVRARHKCCRRVLRNSDPRTWLRAGDGASRTELRTGGRA